MTLRLDRRRGFDRDMNALRCRCYPRGYPTGEAGDAYDDRSWHVAAYADLALAGYLRLTPGQGGWFEHQLGGRAAIPTGPEVVDLNRAGVAPEYRGRGLFEVLLLEGLLAACDLGFRTALGGSRPERGFRPLLHDLGFRDLCGPVEMNLPNGFSYQGIVVGVATTAEHRPTWEARLERTLAGIAGTEAPSAAPGPGTG